MTVNEVRERIIKGECLSDMFEFTDGQDCMIYKGEWNPGDDVIYIPDIDLNEICINRPLVQILDEIEIGDVLYCLYTGKDFMELADGNEEIAKELFRYVDWQHPASTLNKVIDDGGDDDEKDTEQSGDTDITLNHTTLYMDDAIEITWLYDELAKEGKILSVKDVGNSDFIKETIIGIATDFEKEYGDSDWSEVDYLDCLRKFAEPKLVEEFAEENFTLF